MKLRRIALSGVIAGIMFGHASVATAQRSGNVGVGAFGAWTRYDPAVAYENTFGGGARLNVFIVNHLAVEGEVTYTETLDSTEAVLSHTMMRGRVLFDINPIPGSIMSRVHFLVGAGVVHNEYRLESRGADTGFTGLGGMSIRLAPPVSLRFDAVADYLSSTVLLEETSTATLHWSFQGGLSLHLKLLGGGEAASGPPSQSP
jgi:hypothetical protein